MGPFRSCAPLLLALACVVATVLASPIPEETAPEAVRETLESLNLETPSHDESQRDKRTIGFLRNIFPGISEIIDRKIQSLTRLIFRLVGRLVLGGGGGDRSSSSASSSSGGTSRRISITLPTFPPSLDEEDEESQTEQESTSEPNLEDNLAGSESRVNEVRVPYDGDAAQLDEEDQETAATGDEESVARSDESADADNEAAASDSGDRDKRFLFFGGGDSSAGSAGGSGNFLFDIIRSAATTSARTAGRLYRVIAGTDLSDSDNSTIVVRSGAQTSTTLITGSGSSDSSSEADASSQDGASAGLTASVAVTGKDGGASAGAGAGAAAAGTPSIDPNDGYTSGIPGPLTRLFIIANRGISNLLQDLILRLSQTSERIVNFKARLITALI